MKLIDLRARQIEGVGCSGCVPACSRAIARVSLKGLDIALYYIILYFAIGQMLYCIVLYCIVITLYNSILFYIILY